MKPDNIYKLKTLSLLLVLSLIIVPLQASGRTAVLTLESPEPRVYSFFGQAMAGGDINGDGKNEIVIAAVQERVGENHSQGRVYIFNEKGGHLYSLTTPRPQVEAYFGSSLSVGDIDGDGQGEILVGARGESAGEASGAGAAHLFKGEGSLIHTFVSPNPKTYASFGYSVLLEDLDRDGRAEIIIGAPLENTALKTATPAGSGQVTPKAHGRVYVFSGINYTLLETLAPPDLNKEVNVGGSLTAGDLDGDGLKEIIAGALGEETGGFSSQGEVYIFCRKHGEEKGWTVLQVLTTPNPGLLALFGSTVAAGDLNRDGKSDLAIGAPGEIVGKSYRQGRVYIYDGGSKTFTHSLTTPDFASNSYFGGSIILKDVNRDKAVDLIVGAPQKTIKEIFQQGAVHVYSGTGKSLFYSLTTPNQKASSFFGTSLLLIVSSDKKGKLLVGSPGEKDMEGRVYVFEAEYRMPLWGIIFILLFLALMGLYTALLIRRFIRARMIYLHLMEKRKEKLQGKE